MTSSQHPRNAPRRVRVRWLRAAGLLGVLAAMAAALGSGLPASWPATSTASEPPRAHAGRLDPTLADAVRQARRAAAADGVALVVDSGWRSPAHQARLLREAIETYGSAQEAARWVATPETSAHVSGDAVDVGPTEGAAWLSAHGAAFGLCRIYGNEPWHFELRPEAIDGRCPAMYPDPTYDPRLQP